MKENRIHTIDGFTPELKLMLLCSIHELSPEQLRQIQELVSGPMDWELFAKLTVRHRVHPVVYKNLLKIQNPNQEALSLLERRCKKNTLNSLKLSAELVRTMSAFEEKGLRAILLKGPVLGVYLYGDASLRVSRDLDILIDREDVENAEEVLLSMGYHKKDFDMQLSPKQKETMLNRSHHYSYVNKNDVCIELHWNFYYESYDFRFEQAWKEKTARTFSGQKIAVLNLEEDFLYMIFHGSKHAWKRLKWLCDIYELVRKNELDLASVINRSKTLGTYDYLAQALILLNLLFGQELPAQLSEAAISRRGYELAETALRYLLHPDEQAGERGHPMYLQKKRDMYLWHTGFRKKMKYITVHFEPTVNDFSFYRFSDKHYFMYFITHLLLKGMSFFKRAGT